MPNRILRDWTDSHAVNDLTAEEERFFTRLLMKADDFGRFHGHDRLLNANLFPLHKFDDAQVALWCDACERAGVLRRYKDPKNRDFIEVLNFKQRTRQQVSKFPNPDDGQLTVNGQSNGGQVTVTRLTSDRLDGDGDGDGDGGEVGGGKPTNQPDQPSQPPPLSFFLETFSKWDETKVREVFDSFERGKWMWGKNPVKDYVEAFQLRLSDRIKATYEINPIGDVLASLESAMSQSTQTPGNNGSYLNGKKPFISELKEKRRVYQDQIDELRARGNHYATGFEYESKADKLKAIELKKKMKQVDQEILDS